MIWPNYAIELAYCGQKALPGFAGRDSEHGEGVMRHPLVTTTAIAVVVMVIAARSTVSPCAAERELICEANGMTDLSSARRQIKQQNAERRKFHKHATHHHHGGKLRLSHHREKLKLRRYNGRDTLARPSPTPPAPKTPMENVAAAPETVAAVRTSDAPVPVARRLAETFDLVGYDMRRSGREDTLTARAQTASAPAASSPVASSPVASSPAASAAVAAAPLARVPAANAPVPSTPVTTAQVVSVASAQVAPAEMADRAAVEPDAPDDGEHMSGIGAVQVLPLIAFGALGATFLSYVAVDSLRQRRQRRARNARRSYHWHSPQRDIEPGALPAWLLSRQDDSDEISPQAESNEAPPADSRRRAFLRRRIAAFRPLLCRPALLRLRG
jgi:hypothetical protein